MPRRTPSARFSARWRELRVDPAARACRHDVSDRSRGLVLGGVVCLLQRGAGLQACERGLRPCATSMASHVRRSAIARARGSSLGMPRWDHELLASGAYRSRPLPAIGRPRDRAARRDARVLQGGAAGTVSVKRLTGVRSLAIDGKVDASNGADMLTQRLLGLLAGAAARQRAVRRRSSGSAAASRLASALAPRNRSARRRRSRFRPRSSRHRASSTPRTAARSTQPARPPHRRRRTIASAADAAQLRRHRLRSRRTLDGRAWRRCSRASSSRRARAR